MTQQYADPFAASGFTPWDAGHKPPPWYGNQKPPHVPQRPTSNFDFEDVSYPNYPSSRRPSLFDFDGDSYPGAGAPPPPQNFPSLPGDGVGWQSPFANPFQNLLDKWRKPTGDISDEGDGEDPYPNDDDDDDDDTWVFSGINDAPTGGVNDMGDPQDPYPSLEDPLGGGEGSRASGPDWTGWLETPAGMAGFWSNLVEQGGHKRGKAQRLHSMFTEIQGKFMGQLVQDILGGGAPDRKFTNFAEALNLDRLFADLTPAQKGRFGGRHGRSTRYLYNQQ